MSACALPATPIGPMIRAAEEALRDNSYQKTPIGHVCGKYLRALRFAGASPETIKNYETVYARLSIRFDDFQSLEDFVGPVGRQYTRDFLEREWGDASANTRRVRLGALKSLAVWAHEQGLVTAVFTAGIKGPGAKGRERMAHPPAMLRILVDSQPDLRDRCALGLLAFLGLRKNELRLLRVRDIDLTRGLVRIHGKGDKVAILPIAVPELREDLEFHLREREPGEHLLFPRSDRSRPMCKTSVHRWFKRCLEVAELPDFPLHELRHSAGDAAYRASGGNYVMAQQLLRHEDPKTTRRYIHPTFDDLEETLLAVAARWREEGVRSEAGR